MERVAIVNRSTVLTDPDLAKIVAALQVQVNRDFSPIWGVNATLTAIPKTGVIPAGMWWLVVLDTSDEAGALGYHDLTPQGLPCGKAFVKSDIQYGCTPSTTLSHELLEMLADPEINLAAQASDGIFWATEVCDPCEADELGYRIDDVLVSDFITPNWYAPQYTHGTKVDFCGHLHTPFEIAKGGYAQHFQPGSGWKQITNHGIGQVAISTRHRAPVGSRRERRRIERSEWCVSTSKD